MNEDQPNTPNTPEFEPQEASEEISLTSAILEPGISPIKVEDEMHQSFLDYSMSVIVGRALPDARDGMKPVHRRCVYAMGEAGNTHSSAYKKSARVVGDVMGKYHPHGDSSIYDTIVRLAQDFSMRYTLVDGHGNFGSMDGDKAAAMRYTEIRMERFAEDMLEDLDKETVDMIPNYDGTLEEPTVLPSKLPNLLLNGSMGIAVGMATNIPTHNLNELMDAITAMVDNPAITIDELMQYVKGPDFPTGGILCGTAPIRQMYRTGRATLCIRSRAEIVEEGNRARIIVTEIPYGVNKAEMLSRIGELIDSKILTGISDIRDVSKKDVRIEIDLKQDAVPNVVLNMLYKNTQLQTNFGANMLALDHGRPKVMNLKQFFRCFIDHRVDVITRRTKYLLRKAQERAHLLEGFRTAIDNIDEIVHIIRSSKDDAEAKERMLDRFGLDDIQSSAILEMRLKQLTGLSRDKIEEEYRLKLQEIERYQFILANPAEILAIIKTDCAEMKAKYGDRRRTDIVAADGEIDLSKIIANENCVITLSSRGYIKRSSLDIFNEQKRGGKGRKGAKLKDSDFVERVYNVMTHDSLLFFTSQGRVLTIERAWEIPDAEPNSFGRPIINLLQLRPEIKEGQTDADGKPLAPRDAERVLEIVSLGNVNELEDNAAASNSDKKRALFDTPRAVLFATRKGIVKKTALAEFRNVNKNGIKAITITDDDELVGVKLVEPGDEIILVSAHGQAVHFTENQLRSMGRVSRGVRGIRLAGVTIGTLEESEDAAEGAEGTPEDTEDLATTLSPTDADAVCAVVKVEKDPEARLLLVVENGLGAINTFESYPIHKRGGKGVKSIQTENRLGRTRVVFAGTVHLGNEGDEAAAAPAEGAPEATDTRYADSIIVVSAKGQIIRTRVNSIRQTSRGAKGVTVVTLDKDDAIASATIVENTEPEGGSPESEETPDAPAPEAPEAPTQPEASEAPTQPETPEA